MDATIVRAYRVLNEAQNEIRRAETLDQALRRYLRLSSVDDPATVLDFSHTLVSSIACAPTSAPLCSGNAHRRGLVQVAHRDVRDDLERRVAWL